MSNYKIQYDPDNNIINVDDYNDPHSKAIIFSTKFFAAKVMRKSAFAVMTAMCGSVSTPVQQTKQMR